MGTNSESQVEGCYYSQEPLMPNGGSCEISDSQVLDYSKTEPPPIYIDQVAEKDEADRIDHQSPEII